MSPRLPDGEPAPADGRLPAAALAALGRAPFGVYVHVPYCAARCGYCDFNTYVGDPTGYPEAAIAEIRLAARVLEGRAPAAGTVFLGGGTPTLLAPAALGAILAAIDAELGLAPGAEVTVEANPDSVDPAALRALRAAGVTRVSFGVQSTSERVLATLDRRHTPGRALAAVAEARAAGFEHVSVDLIYGTPGETDADFRASLCAAAGSGADHVSAYGLIVEPGTRLHARIARGELPPPDPDVLADRYELADALLAEAGFRWYELSNWARTPAARCRHNLGYWRGGDWWGIGPGAHSHVAGVRWWNVLRPAEHARRLAAGRSPAAGRERPTPAQRRLERLMLELRLAEGMPAPDLDPAATAELRADGLLALDDGRAALTLRGRLLADRVTRRLWTAA